MKNLKRILFIGVLTILTTRSIYPATAGNGAGKKASDGVAALTDAMVDIELVEAPGLVIIILRGPWEDAEHLDNTGGFYVGLTHAIGVHNTVHSTRPDKQAYVQSFRCPAFNDIYDAKKIESASILADRVLQIKREGTHFIHIIAPTGGELDFGGGADVLAIASKILNAQGPGGTDSKDGRGTTAESMEFFAAIKEAREKHAISSTRTTRGMAYGGEVDLEGETLKRTIIAHYIGRLSKSHYASMVNFQLDGAVVANLHHSRLPASALKIPTTGKKRSRCARCCSCFCRFLRCCGRGFCTCAKNKTVQQIGGAAAKVALMALIAA